MRHERRARVLPTLRPHTCSAAHRAPPLPPMRRFWDYNSGHCYQQVDPLVQPGSLESEAGVYASSFDMTGSRLITCNADKTIGCFKPVEDATEATHPGLPFKPPASIRRF